jgi:hypothetical protein
VTALPLKCHIELPRLLEKINRLLEQRAGGR